MSYQEEARPHERWATLRFSIVGPLLAAPPAPGQLQAELQRLAAKEWLHPINGQPVDFAVSTIERWFYAARAAKIDPVAVLRRNVRSDAGIQRGLPDPLRRMIEAQYRTHKRWSYQLHFDNLRALVGGDPSHPAMPSYSTVRRYMKNRGLVRIRLPRGKNTAGLLRAQQRLDSREVRSYEAAHVNALWHLDFHHGSQQILTPTGAWVTPLLLGILDDHSRLVCHAQWYLAERAEELVHGLCQAFAKRGLPRALLTDNGGAMVAAETRQGLRRLGIVHETTLPYSPYQNGKQESFWGQVEGRLLAMLENHPELTLAFLNEATQAWVEMEYQRSVHSETASKPLDRFLESPQAGRPCPGTEALRLAFCQETSRRQRRSDNTLTLKGIRFEIPSRFRHFRRITLRYAAWDLGYVHLTDPRTGEVLARLFPLDRVRNADGRRRTLDALEQAANAEATHADDGDPVAGQELAPLLRRLLEEYAATGMPPAYLPKPTSCQEEQP